MRFLRLQLGLFAFAFAVCLMLESRIGLDPWSSLHDGLVLHSGLSFGRISQITGLALIVISALCLGVRPGLGTLFNMGVIGPWLDLLRLQAWFPAEHGGPSGILQFVSGMLLMGLATGLYIGAEMGAGPRDGFVLGLAAKARRSVRLTRISVELTVLLIGWLLGGALGLGTLLFALGMGPIMQTCLGWLWPAGEQGARARTAARTPASS